MNKANNKDQCIWPGGFPRLGNVSVFQQTHHRQEKSPGCGTITAGVAGETVPVEGGPQLLKRGTKGVFQLSGNPPLQLSQEALYLSIGQQCDSMEEFTRYSP